MKEQLDGVIKALSERIISECENQSIRVNAESIGALAQLVSAKAELEKRCLLTGLMESGKEESNEESHY